MVFCICNRFDCIEHENAMKGPRNEEWNSIGIDRNRSKSKREIKNGKIWKILLPSLDNSNNFFYKCTINFKIGFSSSIRPSAKPAPVLCTVHRTCKTNTQKLIRNWLDLYVICGMATPMETAITPSSSGFLYILIYLIARIRYFIRKHSVQ